MEVRPNLAELDNYVRTNKWYALGLQLGIEDKELEAIKIKFGGDIDECRRAMFRSWLNNTSNPCRKQLLDCLNRKAVDEKAIAEEYEKLFQKTPVPGKRNSLYALLHDAEQCDWPLLLHLFAAFDNRESSLIFSKLSNLLYNCYKTLMTFT